MRNNGKHHAVFDPIPLDKVHDHIGKRVHLSWAWAGANWVLVDVVGEVAHLVTPTTNKPRTAHVSELCYTRNNAPGGPLHGSAPSSKISADKEKLVEEFLIKHTQKPGYREEVAPRIVHQWLRQKHHVRVSRHTTYAVVKRLIAKLSVQV